MDPRFQTSFIPKKPLISTTKPSSKTINLFALVATLIFVSTIALAVGVYFYNNLLLSQITDSKATLERAKGAFEPDTINKIVRLDNRINVAEGLLNNHIASSYLFDVISRVTLKTVRFKNLNYQYLAKDKILVDMKGQAQSFTSVALESDALNAEKALKNPVIGDLALDALGTVSFSVTATIDPTAIVYKDVIKSKTTTP